MFKNRMKEELVELEELKQRLPCSLEAVDYLGEIFVEGTNKLQAEIESARRIPEHQRALINKNYLEKTEMLSDQEQADN